MTNENLIIQKADTLIQSMATAAEASGSGTKVDVIPLVGLFSLEVILKCAFNRDYAVSSPGELRTVLKAMDASCAAFATRVAFPWISRIWGEHLPGAIGKAFREYNLLIAMSRELQNEFYHEELEFDTTEQRFMTALLYNSIDTHLGRTLNPDEILEELVSLCFSGSNTTSTSLTYVLWCLARPSNQHFQNRLREEVRAAGPSLTGVQNLPLLNAVIQETHRVYPSLIGMLPRTLTEM